MYTQCPECGVAFRISADVLKMAAGKVRCGGCGSAFNALEHLSESKPAAPLPVEKEADPDLPELQPDAPELIADTPPETISAADSAALLKTLDQLAGEDIRIEDTGSEWRVVDEDEVSAATQEPRDEPSQVIDEMLFDDDTVLPDDFEKVVDMPSPAKPDDTPSPAPQPEAPQAELELSEPDEWDDLLGDLGQEPHEAPQDADPAEAREHSDEPPDVDTQFEIQAEALGIDLSGLHARLEGAADDDGASDPEPEIDSAPRPAEDNTESTIEEDLIAAAFEREAAAKARFEAEAALQAEREAAAEEPAPGEPDAEDIEAEIEAELEEDIEAEIEAEIAADIEAEIEAEIDQQIEAEADAEIEAEAESADDDMPEVVEFEPQVEDEEEIEDDVDDIAHGYDDTVEKDIATLSMSLDDDSEDDSGEVIATRDEDHVVPEMSEEEKTINMMIDEELFNIAVEDEDGFASTIVQLQPDPEPTEKKAPAEEEAAEEVEEQQAPAGAPGVETIIMEGDFVRAELDKERLAADSAADSGNFGVSIPLNREKDDYERRREVTWGRPGAGTYAAIAGLALLLILQFVHQSRETLATVPAFSSTVGPVYRMLGRPLTPTWDIGGWRFEATKGDTNQDGDLLTIYSRIGNNSQESLPYPLVHLSLTDRFEDVIGSVILEPAAYLPENADPRRLVPPGNTFNAVISIDSPSADATGFKLNVCYRLASGQLRCADHDFK